MDWTFWEQQFLQFLAETTTESDGAHDITHVQRVVRNATMLADAEGARHEIVLPAAWLHDCIVVSKHSPQRSAASREAARVAGDFLRSSGYPSELIPDIQHAIEAHSYAAGIVPRTLEAQVVQDADRLDALGAIGLARCLITGTTYGATLYHPDDPFAQQRELDDTRYMIDHFYRKLLHIADSMHTAKGKAEAAKRTRFLREFLEQLSSEL